MLDLKGMGDRMQKLRKDCGFTQEQIAETLDISVKYLSNIETGRDLCSSTLLLALANQYNASLDYIMGENLSYKSKQPQSGEEHRRLQQELERLSEGECLHLRKYIGLLREWKEDSQG